MIGTILIGSGFLSIGVTALMFPPSLIGFAVAGVLWLHEKKRR